MSSDTFMHPPLVQRPMPARNDPLPRGECGFIHKDSTLANGPRQRCACRSFFPDEVIRTQCGCGHQAWHHEAESVAMVSLEEHSAVVAELRRVKHALRRYQMLEQEFAREKHLREEQNRVWKGIESRLYDNMKWLKVHFDDKVEAAIDKTQECQADLRTLQERLTLVDDAAMDMETRVERIEHGRGWQSRSMTPVQETGSILATISELPIRIEKRTSWTVQVIFMPSRSLKHAFDYNSKPYQRCASRNLVRHVEMSNADSVSFTNRIETDFKGVIRGRPWMPLVGSRPLDEPFGRIMLQQLAPEHINMQIWNREFLDHHCIAHDKMRGDLLFLCLQRENLSWTDIRFLQAVPSFDESCWAHDDELDSKAGFKSLDSELMYDSLDPPPYSSASSSSSRTPQPLDNKHPSRLDVLAASASSLLPLNDTRPAAPPSQTYTPVSSCAASEHSVPAPSERSFSIHSSSMDGSDDEHADKKPKLRMRPSMPFSPTNQTQIYVSGRSKRKLVNKPKEAVRFNVSALSPFHRLGHGKDKAAESA